MSTPHDPQGEGRPEQGGGSPGYGPAGPDVPPGQYNPYGSSGQPGGYRAGQQPGQYTSSPLQGRPYPAGPPPYGGYDPYSGAGPGGAGRGGSGQADRPPARRPGLMVLGLVLMVLAALPFLFAGVAGLLAVDTASIAEQLLNNPRFAAAGATPELVTSLIQVTSGILLFFALVYLVLGILAFRGRNWARILVTVLSVGFVLLLFAGLSTGASGGSALVLVAVLLVATIGAVVILFLPPSRRFFDARRG